MDPDTDVLVVGAGPTGLLLASELVRRGVSCRLIDDHDAPLGWDRATVVHPRSLEVFESLGLVDRFLAEGVRQRGARLHSGGDLLGVLDLEGCGSPFGFNLGISEQVTEAVLEGHLEDVGGRVERATRLVDLTQVQDGVEATLDHMGTPSRCRARWVVGCDGLHSTVRAHTSIELVGHDIERPWAVFDVTIRGWDETYEANFGYLDDVPVILTALPGERWRSYTRPTAADSDVVADAWGTISRYHPRAEFADTTDPVRFQCHTKVADRYREGRCLLAGDAAHVCSPAEGHGMNSGLQDAFNLGWKLALVCRGTADDHLLDSYEAERRPVASAVTASGDATEAGQAASGDERRLRDEAIRAALARDDTAHQEAVAEAELDVDYAGSPIVTGSSLAGMWPGQRLDHQVEVRRVDGSVGRLDQLAAPERHTVLVVGGPSATRDDVRRVVEGLGTAAAPDLVSGVTVAACAPGPDEWTRLDDVAAVRLGATGVVVAAVRPDGHLGLVADADHGEALAGYLRLLSGG